MSVCVRSHHWRLDDMRYCSATWLQERKVKAKSITFHRKKNLQYYDISAKR